MIPFDLQTLRTRQLIHRIADTWNDCEQAEGAIVQET
jgi:hypothetical protein